MSSGSSLAPQISHSSFFGKNPMVAPFYILYMLRGNISRVAENMI